MDAAVWGAAGVIATALFGMIASIVVALVNKRKDPAPVAVSPGIPVTAMTLENDLRAQVRFWQARADAYAHELSENGIPLPRVADPNHIQPETNS